MKKVFASFLCLLFGASFCGAAQMASQPWVESRISDTKEWTKGYVASNSTARIAAFSPVSWESVDENGKKVTVTLSFSIATNDAMMVYESNTPGITNGTLFVKIGDYHYRNAGNLACQEISGGLAEQYTYYGDGAMLVDTNSVPYVTNTVYSTTNVVYGGEYDFSVNGVAFTGSETLNGYISCAAVSAELDFVFKLKAVKVFDWEKEKALEPPKEEESFLSRLFAFLGEMIAPSCYAWHYGAKQYTGSTRDTGAVTPSGQIIMEREFVQYAYTDEADTCRINLGKLELAAGLVYDMTGVEVFRIDAGELVEAVKDRQPKTKEEIDRAIEEKVGSVRWRIHFANRGTYASAVERVIDECNALAAALAGVEYTKVDWDEYTTNHDCENDPKTHLSGECGNWTCDRCGKGWSGMARKGYMSVHLWDPNLAPCHVCANSHCNFVSDNQGDHGGWYEWQDMTSARHYCHCVCGKFIIDHSRGAVIRWVNGNDTSLADFHADAICVQCEICGRCGTEVPDTSTMGGTWYAVGHFAQESGKFVQQEVDDESYCATFQECSHAKDEKGKSLGCGTKHWLIGNHVYCELAEDCEEIENNDDNHLKYNPCMNGFRAGGGKGHGSWAGLKIDNVSVNSNWCGYCFTNEVPHNYDLKDYFPDRYDPAFVASPTHHYTVDICETRDGKKDSTHCGHLYLKGTQLHSFETTNCVYKNSAKHTLYRRCLKCLYPTTKDDSHDKGALFYGNPKTDTHDVSNYCGKCDAQYLVGVSNHIFKAGSEVYRYLDNSFHEISNKCTACEYEKLVDVKLHYKAFGANTVYFYVNDYKHVGSNLCNGCNQPYSDNPIGTPHTRDSNTPSIGPFTPIDDYHHTATNFCRYCQHLYSDSEACFSPADVAFGDTSDLEICRKCSNHRDIPHYFVPDNDTLHHCKNGAGHLYEEHTWGVSDTNVCTKCNWNREEHRQEDTWTTNTCVSCSLDPIAVRCYAVFKNGEYQPFSSNCAAGWDLVSGKCGCSQCQQGILGMCQCKWNDLLKGSNGDKFPGDWNFTGSN